MSYTIKSSSLLFLSLLLGGMIHAFAVQSVSPSVGTRLAASDIGKAYHSKFEGNVKKEVLRKKSGGRSLAHGSFQKRWLGNALMATKYRKMWRPHQSRRRLFEAFTNRFFDRTKVTATSARRFERRKNRELSLQEVNAYVFRRSHSLDPGIPVERADSKAILP